MKMKYALLALAIGAVVVFLLPRRQQTAIAHTPRIHLKAAQTSSGPQVTYRNKEEWEVQRDGAGMIQRIVIHREVTRNE